MLCCLLALALLHAEPAGAAATWQETVLEAPYPVGILPDEPVVQLVRQDYCTLERDLSAIQTRLRIGSRNFEHGLATHAVSRVQLHSPEPLERFSAWVGLDNNDRTVGSRGTVVFSVHAGGRQLYQSPVMRGGEEPAKVDVETGSATTVELRVDDAGDGPGFDHADWGDAEIALAGGQVLRVDELAEGSMPFHYTRCPFSFTARWPRGSSGWRRRSWVGS